MTTAEYVHLVREDVDETECELDLFDSESGEGVEATHRGPGRFHMVTCPVCLHSEICRLSSIIEAITRAVGPECKAKRRR